MFQNVDLLTHVDVPEIKTKIDNFCTGKINISDYIKSVPNKIFDICELCGKMFPDTEHYMNSHFDVSGLIKCCLCLDEKNNKFIYSDIICHINSVHKLMYKCKFCIVKRSDLCELKKHFDSKHSRLFICKICPITQMYLKKMETHVINHFLDDIFKYLVIVQTENLKCLDPKCGHISESLYRLRSHFANHYGKLEYVCEHCTFSSKNRKDVWDHMVKYHDTAAMYKILFLQKNL